MTSRTNYYKTVSTIFQFDEHKDVEQPHLKVEIPKEKEIKPKETFYVDVKPRETFYVDVQENETFYEEEEKKEKTSIRKNGDLPEVFGPPLWFSLHNASAFYPDNAPPVHAERMKNIIIGIPVLIPCGTCKEHATVYIEKNKHQLMEICKTRTKLFEFFVDFHNYVNKRLGKKEVTVDEAKSMYYKKDT